MRNVSKKITSLEDKGHIPPISRLRMQVTTNSKGYPELNLNGRDLRVIPAETFQLTTTQVLRLAHNHIDYLPLMIAYLRSLKVLDLQHNLLVQLPETLVNCRHMAELNLTANRLSSLPKGMGDLKQLRALSLGQNQFEHLPEELGLLAALRDLDIHSNKLNHLPFTLKELRHLRILNASDNMFDDLPWVVTKITSLQKLNLSRNRLTALPVDFDALKNLRELNVSHNEFVSISSLVTGLKHLKYLSLAHNKLRFLPPQMCRLKSLRVLHLQHNSLTRVPSQLANVQYYNVAFNQLTSFSVEGMRGLVSLTASNNNLEAIPRGLYKLKKLQFIYLHHNQLIELGEAISQLQQLRVLDVSNNKLISLPNSIYRFSKLQHFNVQGNHTLRRTGVSKIDHDVNKTDPKKTEKLNLKMGLKHAENETKHSSDSIRRAGNKEKYTAKELEHGILADKNDRLKKMKRQQSEADIYHPRTRHSNHPGHSSDWELRANDLHAKTKTLLQSNDNPLTDVAFRSNQKTKQSMFMNSKSLEQKHQVPTKTSSKFGFREFLFGKSKKGCKSDAKSAGFYSLKKSGDSAHLNSSQTNKVNRTSIEKIAYPGNGHSEMDVISSLTRQKKGYLEMAHDDDELPQAHKQRLSYKAQIEAKHQGKRIDDEDSNSVSHGYGSWRSRGHTQAHDLDTDSLLYNNPTKHTIVHDSQPRYRMGTDYEPRINYHAQAITGQNNAKFQQLPTSFSADKFHPTNANFDSLVNSYNAGGSLRSKFKTRNTCRVRNTSESGDERSLIYSEFNLSSPGNTLSRRNGFYNYGCDSMGKISHGSQVTQRNNDYRPKLHFQNEAFIHDEFSQRSPAKARYSRELLLPYSKQRNYVTEYSPRREKSVDNSSIATFEKRFTDSKHYHHTFSRDDRTRSWPSDRYFPNSSPTHQPHQTEPSYRNQMGSAKNPESNNDTNDNTQPSEHTYIQTKDKHQNGKRQFTPEHAENIVSKSTKKYPEFNHILSTKNITTNKNETHFNGDNSLSGNTSDRIQWNDTFGENKVINRLTRSRSADSLIDSAPKRAFCCHDEHLEKCGSKTRLDSGFASHSGTVIQDGIQGEDVDGDRRPFGGRARAGRGEGNRDRWASGGRVREGRGEGDGDRWASGGRARARRGEGDGDRWASGGRARAGRGEGEGRDGGRTDLSLLGVCSQMERLLNSGPLQPVRAFTKLAGERYADNFIRSPSGSVRVVGSSNPYQRNNTARAQVTGPPFLLYSNPQAFTLTRQGGQFVSAGGSKVDVSIPALAVDKSIKVTIQWLKIPPSVVARVKELNYFVENILDIGPIVFFDVNEEVNLNSPATITIPAPADVTGGHFIVLTVKRDFSCVPSSDGFRSRKMAATYSTWNFTAKVALITRAKCKYKACKSVEQLLQFLGVKKT